MPVVCACVRMPCRQAGTDEIECVTNEVSRSFPEPGRSAKHADHMHHHILQRALVLVVLCHSVLATFPAHLSLARGAALRRTRHGFVMEFRLGAEGIFGPQREGGCDEYRESCMLEVGPSKRQFYTTRSLPSDWQKFEARLV